MKVKVSLRECGGIEVYFESFVISELAAFEWFNEMEIFTQTDNA
jgi:hypothetical protein